MKSNPAVVMGMGPSGLFLVRQLHHITDNIFAVGRNDDVGIFSRHIAESKRFYAQSEETVYLALKDISESENAKPRVYLCSDQYLTMLVNAKRDWSEVCTLAGTDLETLKQINNKAQVNQYCEENGIRIPKTTGMVSFYKQDVKQFPVIIKWEEKELEAKANPVGKVLICRTEADFTKLVADLKGSWVKPEMLLVQTFIEGNNDFQYSVGGYYKEGEPLAFVTVKQVKQFPQGISAQVYTVNDEISDKVERIAFDLAKRFHFTGFLETEFKADQFTGSIFLLDVNPRPWGWVSILGAAYKDFYRVLNNEKPESKRQNAIWTSPIRKALSSKNPSNVKTDKKALRYKKAADITDIEDRMPGLMIYVMALKKKLKL